MIKPAKEIFEADSRKIDKSSKPGENRGRLVDEDKAVRYTPSRQKPN
jgi:hypothetical protein